MLTTAQVEAELARVTGTDLSDLVLRDLIPPAAPPAGWRTPASPAAPATPGLPAPVPSGRDFTSARSGPDRRTAQPTTDEDGDAL